MLSVKSMWPQIGMYMKYLLLYLRCTASIKIIRFSSEPHIIFYETLKKLRHTTCSIIVGPSLSFQVTAYYAISRQRIEQPGSSFGVIFRLFLMKAGGSYPHSTCSQGNPPASSSHPLALGPQCQPWYIVQLYAKVQCRKGL